MDITYCIVETYYFSLQASPCGPHAGYVWAVRAIPTRTKPILAQSGLAHTMPTAVV